MRRWHLLAAAALAGCTKQAAPEDAARRFFDFVAGGKPADAYQSAAYGFRTPQSEQFFTTTLHEMGLDAIAYAKFERPEFSTDRRAARVAAEFTTKAKAVIPLVVGLVHEGGVWKVLTLKSPRNPVSGRVENHFTTIGRDPSFGDPTTQHPAPGAAATKVLTTEALLLFNEAVRQKDFLHLFDEASLHWQDQLVTRDGPAAVPGTMKRALTLQERRLGAGRLQRAFQSFIDQDIDIGGIKGVDPAFDHAPWVNTDGLLIASGYYPTKPYRVLFSLKFYYETPAWRLFGLDVSVKKAE